jgi:putative tryptophan/tyrosine transport system substrate-binding protein
MSAKILKGNRVIKRREFITLVGCAGAWPLAARAQQSAMPVIGFLSGGTPAGYAPYAAAVRQGLKEAGYVEGQNVAIEYRWAEGQNDRLPALAADLVGRPVAVIAAGGVQAALAAKAATTTIPIVFEGGPDPVEVGLVTSLNRPGGNITGVSNFSAVLVAKQFELLHETVPNSAVIGVLVNPTSPSLAEFTARDAQAAGRSLGMQIHILNASTKDQIDAAFASFARVRPDALLIGGDAFFLSRRVQLVTLATRHGLPTIYNARELPAAGGLMSYGASLVDTYRLTGVYTGKILKGAKPAELPVMQPAKFELVINLTTAKALGLAVPDKLLALADEVVE